MTMRAQPDLRSFSRDSDRAPEVPVISVVVPVYKEERNINPFLDRIVPVLERLGSYEIIFCLDPSPDRTEDLIREAIARNPNIGLLVFSRRFGQSPATMAGILNCRGRWCVVIDVDLQDTPETIETLLKKAEEGFDVVTARRASRAGETLVKKTLTYIGYKLVKEIADVSIPRATGDFRIINRRVIEELRGLSEFMASCGVSSRLWDFGKPKFFLTAPHAIQAKAITTDISDQSGARLTASLAFRHCRYGS